VWALLIGVPLATVLAQLALWQTSFSLKGAYLKTVRAAAGGGEDNA